MLFNRRMPRAAAFVVATATAATVASGLTAFSANATGDTTPPNLVAYALVNNTIDVTNAPGGIGVTLHTTDDASGFSGATVVAHCTTNCGPQTSLQSSDVSFTAGPATARQANVVIHVPITAPDQSVWSVDQVTVSDGNDNSQTYSSSATPLPNPAPTFTVTKTPDTSKPSATSLTYQGAPFVDSTPTVNVTTSDKTVNASVHLTDTGAGVDENSIVLTLTGPDPGNGDPAPTRTIDSFQRTHGSVHNGDFMGFFDAENFGLGDVGTWTASLHVADFQGNAQDFGDPSWNIAVISGSDTQGPQLSSDPNLGVSTVFAGDSVSLTAQITDDVTGFAFGNGFFQRNGGGGGFGFFIQQNDHTTGDTYVSSVDVPPGTQPGTYQLASLSLQDRKGGPDNTTIYDGTTNPVPALSLTVNAAPTEASPTLASIQMRPSTVSVDDSSFRSGERSDVAYLAIDDNGPSGFERGRITVEAPDSTTNTIDFDASNRVSGTTASGVYRVFIAPSAFGFPTQDGAYTVTNVDLWSHAQRFSYPGTPTTTLDGSALGQLPNSNLFFTVNHNTGDDAAPLIDSIDLTPAQINTETGDQQVTVTVHAHDTGGSGATSGIEDINVGIKAANSNQRAYGDTFGGFYDDSLQQGDDTAGTYVFTIQLPQWSTPGTWALDSAYIQDNSSNRNFSEYGVLNGDSDPGTIDIGTVGGTSHTVDNQATVGDTAAPAVKNITVDVSPVNASDGASYKLTGTIELTDNLSGVQEAEVDLNGPNFSFASGYTDFVDNEPSAPQLDRTMTWTADIPAHAATGPWTFDIYPYDKAGNGTDIPAANFPDGVMKSVQVNGIPDSQPPTLATNGFDIGSAVDATSGPADDIATFHVLDDGSGMGTFDPSDDAFNTGSVDMVIGRPGNGSDDRHFDAQVLGGTPTDTYLASRVSFSQFGDNGQWVVKSIRLTDANGHQGDPIDESAHTITVTGLDDSVPPVLHSITTALVGSDTNLDHGAAHIAVSADISDAVSGVQFASFSLDGPQNSSGGYAELQFNDVTGRWEGTATIPQWSGVGTWTPGDLFVQDNANNFHDYNSNDLLSAGATPSFTFTGTKDSNSPVLASLSFNPTSVVVSGPPQNVAQSTVASLHITDDLSGFSDGYIQLVSPNGLQTAEGDFGPGQRISGDSKDGTYHVNIQIPATAQAGTWTVSTVWLEDVANNGANITGGLLPTGPGTSVDVTNTNPVTFNGVVNGQVTGPTTGTPLAGAWVSVCNTQGYGCASTTTNGGGNYSVTGLPDGVYEINVSGPSGTTFNSAQVRTQNSLYTYEQDTATENVNLSQPTPMPTGISVNGQQSTAGNLVVPRVFWQSGINLSANGCPNGTASYSINDAANNQISSGSLAETPPGSGAYTGTAPAPYPAHGDVTVTITITCPNPADNLNAGFTMYIDPSGNVTDTHGNPVVGATVTLSRSDTATGTYTQVPNGSAIMSPSNRKNPDTTDSTGHYGWDVTAGFYKVSVSKADCYAPGTYSSGANTVQPVFTTAAQQIPPAVTDLNVTMDCTNIAPVGSFTQSASSIAQHGLVHFDASTSKDANGSVASYTWDFGDGTPTFTSSSPTADHSYNAAGSFTPKLTVTDDQTATSLKSGSAITVTPSSAPAVAVTSKPAALTNATSAVVGFTVTPNASATITSVTCALDGAAGTSCTSPKSLTGLGDGGHSLVIRATDSDGNVGTGTAQWVVDTKAPSVSVVQPASTTALAKTFGVSWGGSDTNGVASFDVQYTKAAWNGKFGPATVLKSATTSTSATFTGVPGYEYCFSVRAHDKAGNVSGYSATKCIALPLDDRALAASAGWKKITGKAFYLGTAMQTAAKGKTLTRKGAVAGRAVLYVDKGKGFGTLNVLYNGKVVKKISLASTKTVTKFAVVLPKITKVTVIVIKTTAAKKVQIDGLLLARF